MKKIKPRWIVIGVIVLALVAGVWRAMSNKRAQQAAASAPAVVQTQIELASSDVIQAELREITQGLDISGTVKALNYAVIKARVAGEVKEVLVREGDHVKAGQVLAHQEALFCWVSKQQVCDNAMEEDLEKENWLDFDVLISTPDMMAALGKLGRVLGPRGLMPNPKTGTVTNDIAKAVKDTKAGKVEFRADKQGIAHVAIGKSSFTEEQLMQNFSTLVDAVLRAKPSASKGTYMKSLYVSSTMGPGIKVDTSGITAEVRDALGV